MAVLELRIFGSQNWKNLTKPWRHGGDTREVNFKKWPNLFLEDVLDILTSWCFFFKFLFSVFSPDFFGDDDLISRACFFKWVEKNHQVVLIFSWSPTTWPWKASVGLVTQHYVRLPGFDMAGTGFGLVPWGLAAFAEWWNATGTLEEIPSPKFNIAPEKLWLADYFPIGKLTFQGLC